MQAVNAMAQPAARSSSNSSNAEEPLPTSDSSGAQDETAQSNANEAKSEAAPSSDTSAEDKPAPASDQGPAANDEKAGQLKREVHALLDDTAEVSTNNEDQLSDELQRQCAELGRAIQTGDLDAIQRIASAEYVVLRV